MANTLHYQHQESDSGLTNMVLWLVFGGITGWLASMIVGVNSAMGIPANIVVGILGSFIGGWITDRSGLITTPGTERPTTLASFLSAILGAIILLLIINIIF